MFPKILRVIPGPSGTSWAVEAGVQAQICRDTIYIVRRLTAEQYRALADFRYQLRRFLHFSEEAARAAGLEPRQHQLLLSIHGGESPTMATLAERMQLRHNSTVELVNRCQQRGLVRRRRGSSDRREVEVELTGAGRKLIRLLSLDHRDELRRRGPELLASLAAVLHEGSGAPLVVGKGRN